MREVQIAANAFKIDTSTGGWNRIHVCYLTGHQDFGLFM